MLYQEDENSIIGQYIIFCKVYSEQRKKHGQTKEAVTETIRICKDRNVLKEYLEGREQEVVDMMMTLFDDEYVLEAYVRDIAKDVAKDVEDKKDRETAERMIKAGKLSIEEIADYVPALSLEELKKIEAKVMQMA